MAASFGKMPVTRARRFTSLFNRPGVFVEAGRGQCSLGKYQREYVLLGLVLQLAGVGEGWANIGLPRWVSFTLPATNGFMTVAWCVHRRDSRDKPGIVAAFVRWSIAPFEHLLQVAAETSGCMTVSSGHTRRIPKALTTSLLVTVPVLI